jgi:hypothetical protein
MKKKKVNKDSLIKLLERMHSNKQIVSSYLKDEIDLKTIREKKIKLAKPLQV